MSEMTGYATHKELVDLLYKLCVMTEAERREQKFCLFVIGRGFLDGQEAYEYLMEKDI